MEQGDLWTLTGAGTLQFNLQTHTGLLSVKTIKIKKDWWSVSVSFHWSNQKSAGSDLWAHLFWCICCIFGASVSALGISCISLEHNIMGLSWHLYYSCYVVKKCRFSESLEIELINVFTSSNVTGCFKVLETHFSLWNRYFFHELLNYWYKMVPQMLKTSVWVCPRRKKSLKH